MKLIYQQNLLQKRPAVESVSAVKVMLSDTTYDTPKAIELSVAVDEPDAENVIAPAEYPAETDVPSACVICIDSNC